MRIRTAFALLAAAPAALAAQSTIILQGRITAGGVPLEGARVTVTNRETGEVRSGGSGTAGCGWTPRHPSGPTTGGRA